MTAESARGRRAPGRAALVAPLVSGAALLAGWALWPAVPIGPFLVFLGAVSCSAWWAGRAAGLGTTALATVALDYFFEEPLYSLRPAGLDTLLELGVFALVAVLVSAANGHLRAARERAEAALARAEAAQAESRRRQRVTEALRDTLVAVSSDRSLADVLALVLREAGALLGTPAVALYRLDGAGAVLALEAVTEVAAEVLPETVPLGATWVGEAVLEQRPVPVEDARAELARERAAASAGAAPSPRERIAARYGAVLAVPLVAGGRIHGGLGLYYDRPRSFSEDEVALATAFAQEAALAIDAAELRAAAVVSAAAAERSRIARDLHDSVAQALYGIGLGARTARALLDRDPARALEPLDYVVGQAEAAMTEMRALLVELRPEVLTGEGVVAALGKLAASLRARHGVEVVAALGDEPDAAEATKEAAYRIAQEALHNAVRHARPRRVEVRLCRSGDVLGLEIVDDGVGFSPPLAVPGHLGLRSMRERAEALGGALAIDSAPGRGTRVRATLPRQPLADRG